MSSSRLRIAGSCAQADAGRSRKRGAELEQAIRDATMAELAAGGYASVTIESVAARAQTGKASIYRRWPTKQDLVLDSLGCALSGPLLRMVERQFDDTVSTRDALLTLIGEVGTLMAGARGEAMRSVVSESLRDPDFSSTVDCDFFDPRTQILVKLLRRGVDRGEVRPDAVTPVVAEVLAGTLLHRLMVRREVMTHDDIVEFVDGFLMPAISPR